jgi:hypothetical protein
MSTAQPNETSQNSLPTWASIPIILLCLFGGVWIIHWYVMSDPLSHESKILGDAPVQAQWQTAWQGGQGGPGGRGRNNGGPGANQRRYIRSRNDGNWDIRTEQARVDVSLSNGKLNWHTITYMGNYSFVPDEVKNTIYSARAIVADNARVAALKLAPDQAKRLRGLSSTITMSISDADKAQLGTVVEAYINAKPPERPAQEPKILQLLDQIAQRSIPATKKLAEDRAAQINAMITPEMWKQDAAMGGAGSGGGKPPAVAAPPAPAK